MDVEFSAEQEQLRGAVRAFLADHAPLRPYVRDHYGEPWQADEVWGGLGDLGVLGLLVPESDGGMGQPLVTMGVALEELGRAVCSAPVISSSVGAVCALTPLASTEAATARASIAAGHLVAALAIDHGRSGPPDVGAVRVDASDSGARLDGTVAWVADAQVADVLLIPASASGEPALFAVEAAAPGLGTSPRDQVDGSRRFGDVALDGVEAVRLGPLTGLGRVVDHLAVAYVLDGLGAAEAALALAVDYAKERRQFGAPIGSFQAVQHLCADMLRDVETTRVVAYYALWAADAADPTEAHRAATMAKAVAAEALPRVGAACIQVHGGVGFTWEHDAHLFHKRLLTAQHVFGTADEHLDELAAIVDAAPS